MKVYINVYHVNKNKIIPSNDPFLMKWSKLQNLIPEEVIDSLPRSSASRVWIMVWRFWSDPLNVRFHSPYWSILSFLFKWSMILRTTDPCSSDFYLRSHSDPKTDPNLIPQYLRITGPFDVRSNLILPLIPEYLKIWSWNDSLLWSWIRRILIWFSSLKPIITGSEFLLLKNIPDFQCIPWICDYSIFYLWILNPDTSNFRNAILKIIPGLWMHSMDPSFLLDPWFLDPHKSNSSSLMPDFMIILPECLQKGSIWEVNIKSHKNQC